MTSPLTGQVIRIVTNKSPTSQVDLFYSKMYKNFLPFMHNLLHLFHFTIVFLIFEKSIYFNTIYKEKLC